VNHRVLRGECAPVRTTVLDSEAERVRVLAPAFIDPKETAAIQSPQPLPCVRGPSDRLTRSGEQVIMAAIGGPSSSPDEE
jgi:hypothetical protein